MFRGADSVPFQAPNVGLDTSLLTGSPYPVQYCLASVELIVELFSHGQVLGVKHVDWIEDAQRQQAADVPAISRAIAAGKHGTFVIPRSSCHYCSEHKIDDILKILCYACPMKTRDARSLSGPAQEDLRRRVVRAVAQGMKQTEAARVFGVARGTVNRWVQAYEQGGARALKAHRRGRPPQPRLAAHQAATTVRMIVSRCPDQLRLPFALWTREAVQQLLARRFKVRVSVWTVGRYLRDWGLTPQKPVRRA